MFFDTVYKCDLHSITPNIKVNRDWSKKENIEDADTVVVTELMVQKTFFPDIYKEIITGKLIHAYKTVHNIHQVSPYDDKKVPNKTVFIKIYEEKSYSSSKTDLIVADACDVEKYIQENSTNVNEFRNKLEKIIIQADEYYNNAYNQGNYSNKHQVKSLIKKIKR